MAEQPRPQHPRPVSPHLQVYRPQLTSVTSILHRITGVGLSIGLLYMVCWLITAAEGQEAFDRLQDFNGSFIGRLLLFGWSLAFFYHLLNGMRHLAWDAGWGFELPTVYKTGWAAIVGAVLLTLIAFTIGYYQMGAI